MEKCLNKEMDVKDFSGARTFKEGGDDRSREVKPKGRTLSL